VNNELVIDLALGPNQGAGVPAPLNSEGLLKEILVFNVTISTGIFDGVVPGWGSGELVSALATLFESIMKW